MSSPLSKWKAQFIDVGLNLTEYKSVVMNTLENYNERAGRAWLHTVMDKTPIYTWSGASRATFRRLAQALGTRVSIGTIRSPQGDRIAMGMTRSKGYVSVDRSKFTVSFTYQTTLPHLIYNEFDPPVPGRYPQPRTTHVRGTPYFFQAKGAIEWVKYAKKIRLPSPWSYLNRTSL